VREWLGRRVHVVVDRPLGSRHPDDPQAVYELNYGYVPGTIAGDGEPIDVYVIDADQPLSECDAEVIAIICRRDDVEDKLVVRLGDRPWTADEIAQRTWFQERWFDVEVEMPAARDDLG
jgi:inorganic pyrophosphatase